MKTTVVKTNLELDNEQFDRYSDFLEWLKNDEQVKIATALDISGKVTGIRMIAQERIDMVEKHGKTIVFDVKHNSMGELKQGSIACLTNEADFPVTWNKTDCDHLRYGKIEIDRLAVAGAFIAAEIDRLLNK